MASQIGTGPSSGQKPLRAATAQHGQISLEWWSRRQMFRGRGTDLSPWGPQGGGPRAPVGGTKGTAPVSVTSHLCVQATRRLPVQTCPVPSARVRFPLPSPSLPASLHPSVSVSMSLTCIHTCTHTQVHTNTHHTCTRHTHIHAHVHTTYVPVCSHVHTHAHTHKHTQIHTTRAPMHPRMHACTHIHNPHVRVYTHKQTHCCGSLINLHST